MKTWTRGAVVTATCALIVCGGVMIAGNLLTSVQYVPYTKIGPMMATKPGGNRQIVTETGVRVLAQTKMAEGAEVHENFNHIFIIESGEAVFVTGGKLVGPLDPPEQLKIEGGQTHHLKKGDVITVPAKTPHWWKEVPTKTITYYAVNIDNQK